MATRTAGRAGLLGLLAVCMMAMACGGAGGKPAGERVLPVHELDSMRLYMETGQWAAVQESGRKLMQAGAAAGQAHQEALRLMAQAYKKQGLADSALAMQEHALRMAQQADDRPSQSSLWLNISTTREELGDYPGALGAALQGLKLKEELQDSMGIARVLHNLALLYWRQDELDQAVATLEASIRIKQRLGEPNLAGSINGLAVLMIEAGRPDTAVQLLHESIRLQRAGTVGAAMQWGNLGLAYHRAGRPDSAMAAYRFSVQQARAQTDPIVELRGLLGLAEVMMDAEAFKPAEGALDSSMVLAARIGAVEDIKEINGTLARLYEATGRAEAALRHYKLYHAQGDSLMNADKRAEMNGMRARFEAERAQRENAQLRAEKALAGAKAERNQWAFAGIIGTVLSLGGLAWVRIARGRERARAEAARLEQQALRLQMDPHFLFNALNAIPGLYGSGDQAKAHDYVGHLSKYLRLVLETSDRPLITLAEELDLVRHYLKISGDRKGGSFTWHVGVQGQVNPQLLAIPPMLVQPLVENAVEHGLAALPAGHVEVEVSLSAGMLAIAVRDNGVGLEAAARRQRPRQGRSRGLELVRQRIMLHGQGAAAQGMLHLTDRTSAGVVAGAEATIKLRAHYIGPTDADSHRG